MSYALLRSLATQSLPATVSNPEDIDLLRAYVAARLVEADIPKPELLPHGQRAQAPTTVKAITVAGRKIAEAPQGRRQRR
ncbi:hypothetical protein [uncultured Xylophilus sp.]|uniref:hypothetical protein n=1 Tax=uncultured Xylophilus sp. TaxID=296832 RepID=UPI0025CC8664|nr:hypothetical protein [uncultured Xylophilus sp.]